MILFRPSAGLAFLFLIIILCHPAQTDIIKLKDGRTIEGKIVTQTDDSFTLENFDGNITVKRGEIALHRKTRSKYEIYLDKLKTLKEDDPKGHIEIGNWLNSQKLWVKAIEHYQKAIELDPESKKVKQALEDLQKALIEEVKKTRHVVPLTPFRPTNPLRLGFDFTGKPPQDGWQAEVGNEIILFFDINRDKNLKVGVDGFALPAYPFVVPIPEKLLLKSGQYHVQFNATKQVILSIDYLEQAQTYVPDAATMTEIRVRAGLRPLILDQKACLDCEKHCDYLEMNGIAGGSAGVSSHDEDPKLPGYTSEGAEAGKASCISIGRSSLTDALDGLSRTVWHAIPMLDPELTHFGAALKHNIGMFYPTKDTGVRTKIFKHPADGAVNVPCSFSEGGEIPDPLPEGDERGCGLPIFILLMPPYNNVVSAKVTDVAGQTVEGYISSPAKPANPDKWPSNSNCAVFLPSKPLTANTSYRVEFQFAGVKEPAIWSFTTGE